MPIEILETPVTDGQAVQGVCAGRMVAYWPTKEQIAAGLRPVGTPGYIPAMITSDWAQYDEEGNPIANTIPCCNLRLFVDGCNVNMAKIDKAKCRIAEDDGCLGSVRFSLKPAYGCWTWIPKA